jgi:acetyltransferase-like isoleucine patch superfamily enzyme
MTSTFLERLWTRYQLRHCAHVGRGTVVRGHVWVRGRGRVFVGDDVLLDGSDAPIELGAVDLGAEIHLGHRVQVAGGTSIESVLWVDIGADAKLGRFSQVMDTNFHRLIGDRNIRPTPAVVRIGEGAVIGARAVVLAGSQIGAGATVEARSVVSKRDSVPAGALVRGNPAAA